MTITTANLKRFARGYLFTGSINGHRLGWTKARVIFDYRNGTERVLFEYECGLELVEMVEPAVDGGGDPVLEVRPRLAEFARPGEETTCTVEQQDRLGNDVGRWVSTTAKLVEYTVAWDGGADTVTPERIVFEAKAANVSGRRCR